MKKKLPLIFLALFIVMTITPTTTKAIANSIEKVTVFFGDQPIELINPAIIKQGRTYLALREMGNLLQMSVQWNNKTKTVSLFSAETSVELKINEKMVTINGEVGQIEESAMLMNNTTYIPIRLVSDALNARYSWNQSRRELTLTPGPYIMGNHEGVTVWLNKQTKELFMKTDANKPQSIGLITMDYEEEFGKITVTRLAKDNVYIKIHETSGSGATVHEISRIYVSNNKLLKESHMFWMGLYPDSNVESYLGNVLLTDGHNAEYWNPEGKIEFSIQLNSTELEEFYFVEKLDEEFFLIREYSTQHLLLINRQTNERIYVHEVIPLPEEELAYLETVAQDRNDPGSESHIIKFLKEENGVLFFEYSGKFHTVREVYSYKLNS